MRLYYNKRKIKHDKSINIISALFISAVGGTVTTDGDFKVHTFTDNDLFVVTGSGVIDLLVIAGGGGAGSSQSAQGGAGGGGAGGLKYEQSFAITQGSYTAVIGAGGLGYQDTTNKGDNGGDTSLGSLISTLGGGGGGAGLLASPGGLSGGSGGGAGWNNYTSAPIGIGTVGQGFDGGNNGYVGSGSGGGGGGGSAGPGNAPTNTPIHNKGVGGLGTINNITGTSLTYAEGGYGGGSAEGSDGSNALPNTGSGGNAPSAAGAKGDGGSGIIIVRYRFQ